MRKAITIILLCIFICKLSAQTKTEISYVGNAGFLIKIGDKKILVDALFKGFEGDYILPEQIQEKLSLAQAPFDDVDLVVVTHAHGDHIDVNMVQQHMKNNPKATFASTKQTVDALNARDTIDNFHARRIGFNPSKVKSDIKDIQGISLEAFYLPHGSESRIINNGFLITVNGVSFFHTGDVDFDQFTFEEFRSLQLPEKKIDFAFIQHFYLTSDSNSRQFVNKGIGGKYILPIHYHFTTPSFDAAIVKENYPDAILFNKELESWKMPAKGNDFTNQNGYYFNQALPGDSALIFAPGIVSVNGRYEFGVSFSPDLEEIYFTGKGKGESSSIYFSKLIDNKWTNPQKANFTKGEKKDEMEAFVNHSGKRIYFTASDSKGVEIWSATRSGDWWTNAKKLDSPINDDMVFYPNEAENGDLFYKNVSKGKMYYAPNRDGRFPEIFEAGIEYGSHGFIAPSKDFMLIDALKENDKTKDKDIHVCFKKEDGAWTKPINLGSTINSNFNETCPSISPDGKYLFFSRYNEEGGLPNIYWANTNIIQKIREKAMQDASPQKIASQKGYYFNQAFPGDSAVIFVPGIFSLPNRLESNIALSPDGRECYFAALEIKNRNVSYKIYQSKYENNKWTEQTEAPFSINNNYSDPVFSSNGKKLYLNKDGNVWMLERSSEGWSEPKKLPYPINSDASEGSITESNDGDIYFSSRRPNGFGGIDNWRINRLSDQPLQAENLGPIMNSKYFDYSPFIAPDGSYLIFGSYRARRDGLLYISFNRGNDEWTTPINMNSCGAKINNTTAHHSNPSLSPDGKYLFFRRHEADTIMDVYWVNAGVIVKLKEKAFQKAKLTEDLYEAVDAGYLKIVKEIIKSNPELLESKDRSGCTPLIRSCFNYQTMGRQVEVAKFLIEAGANVDVIDKRMTTALLKASVGRGPDFELIKLLISKGADVNIQERNGLTALHYAVLYKDLKVARLLLESGADVNISNNYDGPISASTISGTVLQVAINGQSNEMFNLIIENGAKLNIKDSQGNTELHLVALKGNTEQAKILIEHGIDLNAKNNFNRTALYYATKHGRRGVAELLIASGADKNTIVETNYGKAKQLSESLAEGEAYIWDLSYSYAVKTKNNLLVFTLGGELGESSESGLSNGFLNADELKDQNTTIFLRHRDHMKLDEKRFTNLAKLTPDVKIVSSFKPDFSKMEGSEIPDYHLAQPNESFTLNGLKVHPIQALAGGMGYLVEVDGLKIFHAGLHISDDEPEHIESFRKEIDFLKAFGPVDIVMLPTYSHSNKVGAGHEQFLYLLDELAPKEIYLWGANVQEQYIQYAEFLKVRNIPIVFPEIEQAAGELHHYKAGQTKK